MNERHLHSHFHNLLLSHFSHDLREFRSSFYPFSLLSLNEFTSLQLHMMRNLSLKHTSTLFTHRISLFSSDAGNRGVKHERMPVRSDERNWRGEQRLCPPSTDSPACIHTHCLTLVPHHIFHIFSLSPSSDPATHSLTHSLTHIF